MELDTPIPPPPTLEAQNALEAKRAHDDRKLTAALRAALAVPDNVLVLEDLAKR